MKVATKDITLQTTIHDENNAKHPKSYHFSTNSILPDAQNIECGECGKMFSQKSDLTRHIKIIHSKIKDFECLECDKRFCQNQDLAQHVNIVHRKIKSFECPECSHKSLKKSSLISHFKKVHNNKKMECQKRFCQNQGLAQHVNSCLLYTSPSPRD